MSDGPNTPGVPPALGRSDLPGKPLHLSDVPAGAGVKLGRLVTYAGRTGRPFVGVLVGCWRCGRPHTHLALGLGPVGRRGELPGVALRPRPAPPPVGRDGPGRGGGERGGPRGGARGLCHMEGGRGERERRRQAPQERRPEGEQEGGQGHTKWTCGHDGRRGTARPGSGAPVRPGPASRRLSHAARGAGGLAPWLNRRPT